MHRLLVVGVIISLTSCNLIGKKGSQQSSKDSSLSQIEISHTTINSHGNLPETDPYDSVAKAYVDTTTLQGKRHWIMNQFLAKNRPSPPDYDTVLDLTYDGYKDYIIGFYGQAGTGIKNRVKVYFYNPKKNCYILNEQLSDLPNPTFYIKRKKITGFYIGNGAGHGIRLEWIDGKWTTTKQFDVDNQGDSSKWKISYPLNKKTEVVVRQFQMIPPQDILETNIQW